MTPGKVPKRLALRASPSLHHPPQPEHPLTPLPPPRAQELIERLQGIATRPHRLRPAQSSKVRGAGWAGVGGAGSGGHLTTILLSRSPATTAPSSHAAWSRCFCRGRAGWREPGAAPTREQRGPQQWGGGRWRGGDRGTGALCPSRLAEPRCRQRHAGERVCRLGRRGQGPPDLKPGTNLAGHLVGEDGEDSGASPNRCCGLAALAGALKGRGSWGRA